MTSILLIIKKKDKRYQEGIQTHKSKIERQTLAKKRNMNRQTYKQYYTKQNIKKIECWILAAPVSQLIRYSTVCVSYYDFIAAHKHVSYETKRSMKLKSYPSKMLRT